MTLCALCAVDYLRNDVLGNINGLAPSKRRINATNLARRLTPKRTGVLLAKVETVADQTHTEFALEPVDANSAPRERSPRRNTLRGDARRTAEYLASRGGGTPIEALHDVVKLGWRRGVRELAKELRVSPEKAAAIYERWTVALLPYTAPRFDVMDLNAIAAAAAGGGNPLAAHFLAARAMSELLALERESPRAPALSTVGRTVDGQQVIDLASETDGGTAAIPAGLPPKAAD